MGLAQLLTVCLVLSGGFGIDHTEQKNTRTDKFETIYRSKGVVVFVNTDKNLHKDIVLYNLDGTEFATISLPNNFIKFGNYKVGLSGSELPKVILDKKYHFNPQEFYPDYGVIIFAYETVSAGKTAVYIDKEKKITKFIKVNPTLFSIESWKTHLMGAVLEVDNIKNPLRESASDRVPIKRITVPDDTSFRIIKFKDEWVQVECFSFCESVCEKRYKGWIKWTNGKQPLLTLYYAC